MYATAATSSISYNSYQDYAAAYGYSSVDEYMKARDSYDSRGTGHHPGLCSDRCTSCTTR
ncbi:hypothetical protein ACU635_50450 [[Actinomadura] parvosata]|uniref:hypothetical protein n=1 Tax=[Actinomadura] parvosata TaxID=1955412 RepID=UPI00406C72EB